MSTTDTIAQEYLLVYENQNANSFLQHYGRLRVFSSGPNFQHVEIPSPFISNPIRMEYRIFPTSALPAHYTDIMLYHPIKIRLICPLYP